MPIRHTYRPASFLRVDDRTGFISYAENTRKEWNGLIVNERFWEPRQPQDFVRGTYDPQTVPEPRPLSRYQFVADGSSVLTQIASPFVLDSNGFMVRDQSGSPIETPLGDTSIILDSSGQPEIDSEGNYIHDSSVNTAVIYVQSANGWAAGDTIWIMRDSGDYWVAQITAVNGLEIEYTLPIPSPAAAGNIVIDITAQTNGQIGVRSFSGDFTDDFR